MILTSAEVGRAEQIARVFREQDTDHSRPLRASNVVIDRAWQQLQVDYDWTRANAIWQRACSLYDEMQPSTPIRDLRESWAHFVASDCDGGFADLHDAIEVILDDEPLYSAARDMLAALSDPCMLPALEAWAKGKNANAVRCLENARAALAKAKGE